MGLLDFFKKKTTHASDAPPPPSRKKTSATLATTDNGVLGPTYLEGVTAHIDQPQKLRADEWRRKLQASNGQTQFGIIYYGHRPAEYPEIVRTDDAPALVFAVDRSTGERILLFDGCKHGYDAMFCDNYSPSQIANRAATQTYRTLDGQDSFEIEFCIYYQWDFEGEMRAEADAEGMIELVDGSKVPFETAKRDAIDNLAITAIDAAGKRYSIVSEELA